MNIMIKDAKICLGAKRKILPSTVIMLKSDANYTNVYLNDGSFFLSSITLGVLAKRLDGHQFIRPNRSVLVNQHYIINFNTKTYADHGPSIKLKNETIVSISRRKTLALYNDLKRMNII